MSDKVTTRPEKSRYLVKVNLTSARRTSSEAFGPKQYYFEVGKKQKQRTPTLGYFAFNFANQADLKDPINLFTEIIKVEEGQDVEIMLNFKERNKSIFKVDESNTQMKLSLVVGEKRRGWTINDENLELRIHMSLTKTDL